MILSQIQWNELPISWIICSWIPYEFLAEDIFQLSRIETSDPQPTSVKWITTSAKWAPAKYTEVNCPLDEFFSEFPMSY